jgi:hypothetical protein
MPEISLPIELVATLVFCSGIPVLLMGIWGMNKIDNWLKNQVVRWTGLEIEYGYKDVWIVHNKHGLERGCWQLFFFFGIQLPFMLIFMLLCYMPLLYGTWGLLSLVVKVER